MRYEHDVFISYRRYGEWTIWVCDIFKRVLDFHLSNALGRPAKIWTDRMIAAGADWQFDLRKQLTISRVLVPLFSKMYFGSSWCLKELYAVRFKEIQLGLRTPENPDGIIVAARIHDGNRDDLPAYLHDCCQIQAIDLTEYALTSLKSSSEKFVRFEEAIKSWVEESIVPAINRTRALQPHESWFDYISGEKFHCPIPAAYDDEFPDLAG